MKAFEKVLNAIEGQILNGELAAGSILPPERDLAEQYHVSRTAVREAMRVLDAYGLVTASVGAGPQSGTWITADHSPALGTLLQMHVAVGHFKASDAVETRITLEKYCAETAAREADDDDLAMLESLLTQMEDLSEDLVRFNELDTEFHVAMADIGDNKLSNVLTVAIRQALSLPIRHASLDMGSDWYPFSKDLIRQHRSIFEKIASKDSDNAAAAMEEHIRTAYAILDYSR